MCWKSEGSRAQRHLTLFWQGAQVPLGQGSRILPRRIVPRGDGSRRSGSVRNVERALSASFRPA